MKSDRGCWVLVFWRGGFICDLPGWAMMSVGLGLFALRRDSGCVLLAFWGAAVHRVDGVPWTSFFVYIMLDGFTRLVRWGARRGCCLYLGRSGLAATGCSCELRKHASSPPDVLHILGSDYSAIFVLTLGLVRR